MQASFWCLHQKQPSEVFYKKWCSSKFGKCHRKTPVLEYFLMKFQAWRSTTLLKETPTQLFSCEICDILKNTYSEELLQTAASVSYPEKSNSFLSETLERLTLFGPGGRIIPPDIKNVITFEKLMVLTWNFMTFSKI